MAKRSIILGDWEAAALQRGASLLVRAMNPQPKEICSTTGMIYSECNCGDCERGPVTKQVEIPSCPFGSPGDTLACREKFRLTDETPTWVLYAADSTMRDPSGGMHGHVYQGPWRSPATMPRWAARAYREITEVQARRLQSITVDETLAAGGAGDFTSLWDSHHKPGQRWADNPWAWFIGVK